MAAFAAAPYATPSVKKCSASVGEGVYQSLLRQGALGQVSPAVAFRRQDYDEMLRRVREHLEQQGTITVAQFRDMFSTSHKYALAVLEYLDEQGLTTREGDLRKLNH